MKSTGDRLRRQEKAKRGNLCIGLEIKLEKHILLPRRWYGQLTINN